MSPIIDLDATDAQSLELIEEGEYPVTIIEVRDAKVSAKGTKYLPIVLEIIDGQHKGRKLWRNCPIDGEGAGIFVDLWNKATGADLDVGEMHPGLDTDELIGQELRAVVGHEQYQGETRANVKNVLSA